MQILHILKLSFQPVHSGALRPPLALAERRAELRAPAASLPCIFSSDCGEQCAGALRGNCGNCSTSFTAQRQHPATDLDAVTRRGSAVGNRDNAEDFIGNGQC
ncbi:uncharacterized [Tachysurus ichikawai]